MEPGDERITLYADSKGYTHTALQMPGGRWRSKIGNLELIEHQTPALVDGGHSSNAQVYIRRRIPR